MITWPVRPRPRKAQNWPGGASEHPYCGWCSRPAQDAYIVQSLSNGDVVFVVACHGEAVEHTVSEVAMVSAHSKVEIFRHVVEALERALPDPFPKESLKRPRPARGMFGEPDEFPCPACDGGRAGIACRLCLGSSTFKVVSIDRESHTRGPTQTRLVLQATEDRSTPMFDPVAFTSMIPDPTMKSPMLSDADIRRRAALMYPSMEAKAPVFIPVADVAASTLAAVIAKEDASIQSEPVIEKTKPEPVEPEFKPTPRFGKVK